MHRHILLHIYTCIYIYICVCVCAYTNSNDYNAMRAKSQGQWLNGWAPHIFASESVSKVRAFLMECTELPPYSDAVRHATGLPATWPVGLDLAGNKTVGTARPKP